MLCSRETKELFSAIGQEKADQVEYWLKKGADTDAINSYAETPLINAAKRHCWHALKVLVKHSKETKECKYAIINTSLFSIYAR